jgi:hypothetical protein
MPELINGIDTIIAGEMLKYKPELAKAQEEYDLCVQECARILEEKTRQRRELMFTPLLPLIYRRCRLVEIVIDTMQANMQVLENLRQLFPPMAAKLEKEIAGAMPQIAFRGPTEDEVLCARLPESSKPLVAFFVRPQDNMVIMHRKDVADWEERELYIVIGPYQKQPSGWRPSQEETERINLGIMKLQPELFNRPRTNDPSQIAINQAKRYSVSNIHGAYRYLMTADKPRVLPLCQPKSARGTDVYLQSPDKSPLAIARFIANAISDLGYLLTKKPSLRYYTHRIKKLDVIMLSSQYFGMLTSFTPKVIKEYGLEGECYVASLDDVMKLWDDKRTERDFYQLITGKPYEEPATETVDLAGTHYTIETSQIVTPEPPAEEQSKQTKRPTRKRPEEEVLVAGRVTNPPQEFQSPFEVLAHQILNEYISETAQPGDKNAVEVLLDKPFSPEPRTIWLTRNAWRTLTSRINLNVLREIGITPVRSET